MKVIFISDSRLCGVERINLGSNRNIVRRINYQCVPGLKLGDVKRYVRSESFENLCTQNRVVVFLSVGINNIPEDIYGRTGEELNILYKRIVKKFNQIETAVKTVAINAKVVIATIPPTDLKRTIRKYPHKSEKLGTITHNHQQSFENFVTRINEDFINDFNKKETRVHIPLHRALRQHRGRRGSVYSYNKLCDGLHPDCNLKKHWIEMKVSRLVQCI
ncbi:unnamed protein product [Mytilus coruscus]|uniref:Uncharacterized protein n=1 Tax=Mytilus coruscus TaxID=42192 RepID=A0A6J8DC12_MYTCO|nr:unnamed protein product [Mytilus coruscus]